MHKFFGTLVDDEIRERFNGEPIELPLTFWIMRNVRAARQTLARAAMSRDAKKAKKTKNTRQSKRVAIRLSKRRGSSLWMPFRR
jgi:hypothetical protein